MVDKPLRYEGTWRRGTEILAVIGRVHLTGALRYGLATISHKDFVAHYPIQEEDTWTVVDLRTKRRLVRLTYRDGRWVDVRNLKQVRQRGDRRGT